MLTLANYISLMSHALGKTPDSRHNLYETFNRAGRALVTLHKWNWRLTGPVAIDAIADQPWLDLPANFALPEQIWIDNSAGGTNPFNLVRVTTIADIARLRSDYGVGIQAGTFHIAQGLHAPQAGGDTQPTQRWLCYPTPTSDAVPSIQCIYWRKWREMNSGDTEKVPDIPLEFEHALTLACRAYAQHIEDQMDPLEDPLLKAEVSRLLGENGQQSPELGQMTGGAMDAYTREAFFNERPSNTVSL